ncbi:MAG: class C sortase [Ruminococcaceae bacterium]|nr:class C sortase [Oscillospiraceae bacterium]
MKGKKVTVILLIVFFIGLSVLLYPSISSYWNSKTQSEAIVDYESMLAGFKPEDYTAMFEAAHQYNRDLAALPFPLQDYRAVEETYWKTLDVTGTGMMGYVTVPKIGEELPLYHGAEGDVLANAAGHFQGSSLPVGGEGTHSVISAHRGLPTATLFTHLDRMEIGDAFTITILDREFTYEVDQIRIVQPDDTNLIQAVPGKDYCTLLTCTPYGINTERLLVRGHAVDASQQRNLYVGNEAYRVDTLIVMPIVAMPMIVVLLIYVMFAPVKKKSTEEEGL